jgi:hypothetical protein
MTWLGCHHKAAQLFGWATTAGILGGIYVVNPEFTAHKVKGPMLILAKDLKHDESSRTA